MAEDQRHTVVDVLNRGIGLCSEDHKAVYSFHIVIDACQVQRFTRNLKEILVLSGIPFIVPRGGYYAPLGGHAPAEHGLFTDRFSPCIDHQPAAPAGDAPPLELGHDLGAAGDQNGGSGRRRYIARHGKVQFVVLMAAALSIPHDLLKLLVFAGRKLVSATHPNRPLCTFTV